VGTLKDKWYLLTEDLVYLPNNIRFWWIENKVAFPLIFKKSNIRFNEYFMKWFWKDWLFQKKNMPDSFLNFVCRFKGHPGGRNIYSNGGYDYEPHECCNICGEDFY